MAAGTTPLTATEFLAPSVFTSDVRLITFDDLGLPASSQFTSRFRTYPGQRSQLYVFPGISPAGRPGILEHDQFQRAGGGSADYFPDPGLEGGRGNTQRAIPERQPGSLLRVLSRGNTACAGHGSDRGVTDPPAEPSAEPEAFGLLAPQRGLTATEHQARHARADAHRSGPTTRSKAQAWRPTTQGGPRPPVRSGGKPSFRICPTSTASPAEPGISQRSRAQARCAVARFLRPSSNVTWWIHRFRASQSGPDEPLTI